MKFKRTVIFIILLFFTFSLSKSFFAATVSEEDDYVILINDKSSDIYFAGMRYSIDSDFKNISMEFQMSDKHTCNGKQGVVLSLGYSGKTDTLHIDSSFETPADASFLSADNLFIKTTVFEDHTNVRMTFNLIFREKIKDTLTLTVTFVDAYGGLSSEISYILYSPGETSEIPANTEITAKPEETAASSEKTTVKAPVSFPVSAADNFPKYSAASGKNSNRNYESTADTKSSLPETVSEDISNVVTLSEGKGKFGLQQIIAVILSAFLIAAAVIYIIIGIKRNKVT